MYRISCASDMYDDDTKICNYLNTLKIHYKDSDRIDEKWVNLRGITQMMRIYDAITPYHANFTGLILGKNKIGELTIIIYDDWIE